MGRQGSEEKSIFLNAIDLSSDAERFAYLAEACGEDRELRDQVEALIHEHEQPQQVFDRLGGVNTVQCIPITETAGDKIGRYKLREQIGEGGFGVVYVAEQTEPVTRKVALKIIKPGMDTKDVIARFEAERQALALMDHPNVAKVLDAGSTESGRHYFVMELVKGVSITEFCDEQKLSTRERLELFVDICRAVQHAHQKGIIHRDIKPSNIMVTMYDNNAVPKVIDFGVSKALSRKLTDKTVYTAYDQMIGTPLYMSPEQAELSGLDIDTRSDIYSLGVLLYELLTGTTPFDKETIKQAGLDELRRIIREDEPPRPSARISTLNAELFSTVSDKRRIDVRKLSRSYRGELDWIVMKALEKDRNRRYESASAFAADIQRYLNDEPVHACPPSLRYRVRKFVRQNKGLLSTVTLVAVALLVGTAVSIWQAYRATKAERLAQSRLTDVDKEYRRAENNFKQAKANLTEAQEQRRRAEENLRLALAVLDDISVPAAEKRLLRESEPTPADRELLRAALKFYEQFARNNTDTRSASYEVAKAYRRVGEINQALGLHGKAEQAYGRSIADFNKLAREFPGVAAYRQALADSYNNLGNSLQAQEKFSQAESEYGQAIDLQQMLLDQFPDEPGLRAALARSHNNLGVLLVTTERLEQARQTFHQAGDLWQQLADDFPKTSLYRHRLCASQMNLANVLKEMGDDELAKLILQRSLKFAEALVEQFPERRQYRAQLARSHNTLGVLWQKAEKYEDAETALNRACSLWVTLVEEWPNVPSYQQDMGGTYNNLGRLLRRLRRQEESADAYRDAAKVRSKLVRKFPQDQTYEEDLARICATLGDMLRSQPHTSPEAVTWFREAGDHWENLADDSPSESRFFQKLAQTSNKLGILLAPQDPTGANQAYQKSLNALQTFAKLDPENSSKPGFRDSFAKTHHNLGLLLTGIKPEQAEESLRMALNEFRKLQAEYPDSPTYRFNVATANNALGNLTFATGRKQDAKQFFQQARDIRTELAEKYSSQSVLQNSLAWFLATCPDPEFRNPSRAVKFAQRAIIQREKRKGHYYNTLGVALYRACRWELARKTLEASVSLNKGGDGSDWIFLAMVHWQLKNHDQAHR